MGSSNAQSIETGSESSESRKRRLLLVEDDFRTQNALRKIFAMRGWDVQSAMTVSSGLALLSTNPEVILLDLMLPDGDGIEVLRKVRSDYPFIRVAVTTGVEDRERLEEIQRLQPDALLQKPLELNDLLRVIESNWTA